METGEGGSDNYGAVDGSSPLQHPPISDQCRVCGGHCSMTNIGLRALVAPFFIWNCAKGAHNHEQLAPLIRACDGDRLLCRGFPSPTWRDHIPYILSLDLYISNLNFNSTIHSFTNQYIGHTTS
jgi:hypothetical protein